MNLSFFLSNCLHFKEKLFSDKCIEEYMFHPDVGCGVDYSILHTRLLESCSVRVFIGLWEIYLENMIQNDFYSTPYWLNLAIPNILFVLVK